MSSEGRGAGGLTLEELVAIQPRRLRGRLERGRRGPDGERPGRGRAQSLDFEGLSPYQFGDDPRAIDWRASLRSGEDVVRRFAAASHRRRMLAVELKPTLYFATDERLMAKTACLAAAWFAWTSHLASEPVGLTVAGRTVAPRRGRRHVLRALDALKDGFATQGRGAAPVDWQALAGLTGRGDEICMICEPPDHIAPLAGAARALSGARVMRLILVEDPLADSPPHAGRYPVRNAAGVRTVLNVRGGEAGADARMNVLVDAGWRVERARDLLPRAAPA